MKSRIHRSAGLLSTRIQKLLSEDLAKENDYLRQENKILRSKLGKRVPLTETDRRTLVRYSLPIKDQLLAVISIVCPETLLAWNRRMKRRKWTFDNTPKRLGRPSKAKATEALALRMARANTWGYVRIAGESRKLGHKVSPSCVRDLMKKHLIPPSPHRTPPQLPMCSAFAERFVRETRETLDRLIPLGEGRLRHVLKKTERHHNQQRPHQGLKNVVPLDFKYPDQPVPAGRVCSGRP